MSVLSPAALAGLVAHAGPASTEHQVQAVAVILAESGGITNARNSKGNSRGIDRGLWQINSSYHPEVSDAAADDPTSSTAAAYRISRGFTVWSEWSSFGGIGYTAALPAARAFVGVTPADAAKAANAPGAKVGDALAGVGGAVTGAAGGLLTGVDAIGGFFGHLSERGTWVRVAQVVGGAALIVYGASLLGRNLIVPAAGAVADFIPAGRAVKAAGAIATKTKTATRAATKTTKGAAS